jgi:hypothetical protein
MNGNDEQQQDDSRSFRPGAMSKMPEVPDMTGKLVPPRRDSPFALSDFSSRAADTTTKP